MNLDEILIKLQEHHQRAAVGAVGGVLGRLARSVMDGRPHSHLNSWVVNLRTHLPTDYLLHEHHPNLEDNAHVIRTPEELLEWLEAHP